MRKTIIALLASLMVTPSIAHHGPPHYTEPWHNINRPPYNYHRHHHPQHGWGWVVPVLIGGVIVGYEWSRRQQPIIVQQPPVIVYPNPNEICSEWREIQYEGKTFRERTCRTLD